MQWTQILVLQILANTEHSAHMQSVSCRTGSLCVVRQHQVRILLLAKVRRWHLRLLTIWMYWTTEASEMVDRWQQEGHGVLLEKQTNSNWISTTNAQNLDWKWLLPGNRAEVSRPSQPDSEERVVLSGWTREIKRWSSSPALSESQTKPRASKSMLTEETEWHNISRGCWWLKPRTNRGREGTHTQNTQPFYGSLDFVRNNPGEPVPEETFIHSHPSWSSIIPIYFLHLLWSMASSLFNPCALQSFPQSLSKFSLVYLLAWHPSLHIPMMMGVSEWMFLLVPAHPDCPGKNP